MRIFPAAVVLVAGGGWGGEMGDIRLVLAFGREEVCEEGEDDDEDEADYEACAGRGVLVEDNMEERLRELGRRTRLPLWRMDGMMWCEGEAGMLESLSVKLCLEL